MKVKNAVLIGLLLFSLVLPAVAAAEPWDTLGSVFENVKSVLDTALVKYADFTGNLKLDPDNARTVGFLRICFFFITLAIVHAGVNRALGNQGINQHSLTAIAVIVALIGSSLLPGKILVAGGGMFTAIIAWILIVGLHIAVFTVLWNYDGLNFGSNFFNGLVRIMLYGSYWVVMILLYNMIGIGDWALWGGL